jgi:predicted nucleotidyltransferase
MVTREKIFVKLLPNEQQAIEKLLSRLREVYGDQIQQAMLFGSKARGEAVRDSDIDVMVLVKDETWPLKDGILANVADINLEYDLVIDVRVIGVDRWQYMANIQAGLYRTISQDAIPLAI